MDSKFKPAIERKLNENEFQKQSRETVKLKRNKRQKMCGECSSFN